MTRPTPGDEAHTIRTVREYAGLTQAELAAALSHSTGLSAPAWRAAIGAYETGTRKASPERLAAILRACGVDDERACALAVLAVVRPALAGWIDTYGAEAVVSALGAVAGFARVAGSVGKKGRVRR